MQPIAWVKMTSPHPAEQLLDVSFAPQAKSAYDAIDSARQMWSQASDERQEMRSTHVALEAQVIAPAFLRLRSHRILKHCIAVVVDRGQTA